jgi:D-xylose transport system substrate-binding protein
VTPDAGARIEAEAAQRGVPVIDYDQFPPGSRPSKFVGFGDVQTGDTIGQGLVQCISDWRITHPHVLVVHEPGPGRTGDTFVPDFAQQFLEPYIRSGRYAESDLTAPSSDPSSVGATVGTYLLSHPEINAVLATDDATASEIAAGLQRRQVPPRRIALTGAGGTLVGLHNVLAQYQCGSTYAPINVEARDAAGLALYLRARSAPPRSLVNGEVQDPQSHAAIPSVLLSPLWVTTRNLRTTVVADGAVAPSSLCEGAYAADCRTAGVVP